MLTPSRLSLARKRKGMTIAGLSAKTRLSTRILSSYENGHKQPSTETVDLLAISLEVPRAFLEASELEEIPLDSISFRALSKMTASQREGSRSSARVAVTVAEWVEDRFDLPFADIPSPSRLDPESAAEFVRGKWGLGEAPISNMVHLLEAHGVRVFATPRQYSSVDAFSFFVKDTPYIFLNTLKSGERGRFDAAHELGHLVLHRDDVIPHGPEVEAQANRFAAALLMPRGSVLARGLRDADVAQILRVKPVWNVAAMALTHRLHELGIMSEWKYRANCKYLSRLGYRSGEPGGIPRERSQLLEKVFRALRQDGYSIATAANEMNLFAEELNEYVFGLMLTSIDGSSSASQTGDRPPLRVV